MAIYTVLAPALRDGEAATDPMKTVFVKDGFSWPALFFAVIWLIYRRMWLVLVVYVAVALAAGFVVQRAGGDDPGFAQLLPLPLLLFHLLFALEANNLRRWTLERGGFRLIGVAEGRNIEEAEIGYFAGIEAGEPVVAVPPGPPTPPAPPALPVRPTPPPMPGVLYRPDPVRPSAEAGDVVGLFPAPATPPGGRSS